MPFPPQQPGPPGGAIPGKPPKPSDGKVDSYQRVVNGKVVKVNAYSQKDTTTTSAAKKARLLPGRPRIMAQPGTYSSGRDIPGQKAVSKPEPKVVLDEFGRPIPTVPE